jgi:tRNA dimethylallyltransferase
LTPSVLAIFGPTATGKSVVAEAIADRVPAEVVSADSAQVYRGLPILTDQSPSPAHLVAIWELDHEASVAEYQGLAHRAIDGILERGRTPIVVGGTGLYFRAAVADLELPRPPAPGERERWELEYDRLGPERAHALLADHDADAARRMHRNDRRRVVRALELAAGGGESGRRGDRLWSAETRLPTLIVGLEVAPEELQRRIERRTRVMLERGARAEARDALSRPLSITARKVLGLREAAELPSAEALAALVLRTQQLASYQRKWMRRIPGLIRVAGDRPSGEIADEILEMAGRGKRLPAHGRANRR